MPRKSKKKLNELIQTDAKDEKFQPTTLMQIIGSDTGLWKYGTMEASVYEKQIKEMNLSDLQNHALKIGMVPSMSRDRIEKQLLVKFAQWVGQYKKPVNKNVHEKDLPKDKLKAALDIMSAVK